MNSNHELIKVERRTYFEGNRRIGLDANILIYLYRNPTLFSYEESRIFNEKDIMYTHSICLYEFVKRIMNDGIAEETAKKEALNFLESHNINRVKGFITEEDRIKFEEDANNEFTKRKVDFKCHKPDSIIILAFKRNGINKVISTDSSFRESAKLLGMDAEGIPSMDAVISRKLKELFDYKRNKRKR